MVVEHVQIMFLLACFRFPVCLYQCISDFIGGIYNVYSSVRYSTLTMNTSNKQINKQTSKQANKETNKTKTKRNKTNTPVLIFQCHPSLLALISSLQVDPQRAIWEILGANSPRELRQCPKKVAKHWMLHVLRWDRYETTLRYVATSFVWFTVVRSTPKKRALLRVREPNRSPVPQTIWTLVKS